MELGSELLDLTVVKRDRDKIRAVIKTPGSSAELHYLLSGKNFYLIKESGNRRQVEELDASKAEILFDLIGLNPDYHIGSSGAFELPEKIFAGYLVKLSRKPEQEIEGRVVRPPAEMILLKKEDIGETPIRRIEFLKFAESRDHVRNPTFLRFTDLRSNATGTISLDSVNINAGVPEFLFELKPNGN